MPKNNLKNTDGVKVKSYSSLFWVYFIKKKTEKRGFVSWVPNIYFLGKGLGKNEDGISTAIKPKLKFDNAGVGHEHGKDFTNNWWERVYSSALDNVEVSKLFTTLVF